MSIRALIGLGNPGPLYTKTRHNIGFRVLDAMAEAQGASWTKSDTMLSAEITMQGKQLLLVKPMTGMNNSGVVIAKLKKRGITAEEILVVHDELEKPFGSLTIKQGGSAKGHNGLRSLIAALGSEAFHKFRFGIGRPEQKEEVPKYVLSPFSDEKAVDRLIEEAVEQIAHFVV